MLGLVGLFAAGVEVLTWPLLDMRAAASIHAILIAVTILGSVALLVLPVRDDDLAAALVDRRASGLLLAMVDVDGLKIVNDTLGHPAGDRVLQATATALRSHVRAEDRVYRIGGDEFAAISTSRDPGAFENRLGHHIEVEVPGLGWQRASVGVARGQPGDEPAGITSRADAALYEARHSARSGTPPGIGTADEMVAAADGPT